ncbi:MAG: uroporphyrinogen decarboxylase family protein [Chloroflexota bacterium]
MDFLATPEVWEKLVNHYQADSTQVDGGGFFAPEREAVLQRLGVDCRVISYDMFCAPPAGVLKPGAGVDWWSSLARSTPNRMWRQTLPDGSSLDIFGRHTRTQANETGQYEEFASWPLRSAGSVEDLKAFAWPTPDWWDFSTLPDAVRKIDPRGELSLRYRVGTVFEAAWQLRGMEEFLTDMAMNPDIPLYIMERLAETLVENTRTVLAQAGDAIDVVYFYDDVGAQNGLLISKKMWQRFIKPLHQRIIDVAKSAGKKVMYHCDGAILSLVPELIDMGIDILDPIQPTAKDMQPERLKAEFGDRLCFHGGVDIVGTLPRGTPDEVRAEVRARAQALGSSGGYILSSSHHIQSDTPLENVLAMYELDLRAI